METTKRVGVGWGFWAVRPSCAWRTGREGGIESSNAGDASLPPLQPPQTTSKTSHAFCLALLLSHFPHLHFPSGTLPNGIPRLGIAARPAWKGAGDRRTESRTGSWAGGGSSHTLLTRWLAELFTHKPRMFQVMDSDGSGRISFHELCTEIKKLVRKLGGGGGGERSL